MRKTTENFVSKHEFAGEYDALFVKHEITAAQLDCSRGQSIMYSVPGTCEYSATISHLAFKSLQFWKQKTFFVYCSYICPQVIKKSSILNLFGHERDHQNIPDRVSGMSACSVECCYGLHHLFILIFAGIKKRGNSDGYSSFSAKIRS